MRNTDINIRDPFILVENGKYYMYGTRAATCWGAATGFDCHVSEDMEDWTGPVCVFDKPDSFWADLNCWAPEVHKYQEAFYMFATFKDSNVHGGTAILKADNPLGPFALHSGRQVTPKDWECIDGTFYVSSDGTPYMVFVHEWVQISDGSICAVKLSRDLREALSEPEILFHASEATSWVVPITNRKRPGIHYVADGPYLYRTAGGRLLLLWSSFGKKGYTEAIAYSDNGDITGKWTQAGRLLFERDGGHGMIFRSITGELFLTLHTPNEHLKEHPEFYRLKEEKGALRVSDAV